MKRFDVKFLILLLLNGILAFEIVVHKTSDVELTDIPTNFRLPTDVVPNYYVIHLTMYPEKDAIRFTGTTKIIISIPEPTQRITFHAYNLLMDMRQTKLSTLFGIKDVKLMAYKHDNETQTAIFIFDEILEGTYILKVTYIGKLSYEDDALFRTTETNGVNDKWLVATQFKPNGARRLFPCWDEPSFKNTFDISIRHNRSHNVISNMPIRVQERNDDPEMVWTHFETTPKLSTYLVMIAMTNLDCVINETDVRVWSKSDMKQHLTFALQTTKMIGKALDEYTKVMPLNITGLNLIVMPGEFKAMQSWGLVIYSEQCVALDKQTDDLIDKIHVTTAIAHEMVPMWFGDLVSPSWWTDEWLHEGITMYIQLQILQKVFKTGRIIDTFLIKTLQEGLHTNINLGMHSIIESTVNRFDDSKRVHSLHQYTSDPILIRMLQHIITEEVFQEGVVNYLDNFQYKSTTTSDFWATLQHVLDKQHNSSNSVSIQDIVTSWLEQSNYPLITVSRDYNSGQVAIHQRPFMCKNNDSYTTGWWIPVTIATNASTNFSITFPKYKLNPDSYFITVNEFPKNDWIIVNLQQVGYYRVNYDATNWRRLTEVLNSERYIDIHVLNRAQLIDDAYHLILNELVPFNPDILFNLMNYLQRETDHIPWYPMSRILEDLSDFFNVPESQYVKSRFIKILGNVVENIGYDSQEYDTESMKIIRPLVIYWACKLGYEKCLLTANKKLNAHLESAKPKPLSPSQEHWMYCMGMKNATVNTAVSMYNKFIKTGNPNIMKYMACADDHPTLLFYLELMTSSHPRVAINIEHRNEFYNHLVKRHAYNDIMLDMLLQNFKTYGLTHSTSSATMRLIDIIENTYQFEQLKKITEFVIKNIYNIDIDKSEIMRAIVKKELELAIMKDFGNKFQSPEVYWLSLSRVPRHTVIEPSMDKEIMEGAFTEYYGKKSDWEWEIEN